MNKFVSTVIVFFLLLLTTCTHVPLNKYADYKCIITPGDHELSKDERAHSFTINIDTDGKLSEYDYGKMVIASHLVGNVIRTERFRQAVLNYEHNGYKGFLDTNMTRDQVYETIIKGSEKHSPEADNTMNFIVTKFKSNEKEDEKVIAFVYSSKELVYFNEDYLYHNTLRKSNTIAHEWLHMLGFEHEKEDTDIRDYTVPYAVGGIIQEIAYDYYKSECWWK